MTLKMNLSSGNLFPGMKLVLVAGVLAGSMLASLSVAQSTSSASASASTSATARPRPQRRPGGQRRFGKALG